MVILRPGLLVLVIMPCLLLGAQAQPPAVPVATPPPAIPVPPDWWALREHSDYRPVEGEIRGIWMHNYAQPSWTAALRMLADANFSVVFPYMMSGGVAFYRSAVLSRHPSLGENGDCLRDAVVAAKAAGISVHARMLNLTTLFAPAEVRRRFQAQGRLALTSAGKPTEWLCPSNLANRKEQVTSALEMLGYGVEGIQFDYLRYPGKTSCFCNTCRRTFERDLGLKVKKWPLDAEVGCYRGRFADWRRNQLTSLVAELSTAIRKAKPQAVVSAAVFLNWESHRDTFGQDWKTWVERGLVDFVCPMNYTADNDRFRLYISRQQAWIGGKGAYAAGIGINADGHHFPGPRLALEQVRIAREHGAGGFVIFNYCDKFVEEYLPAFAATVTGAAAAHAGQPSSGQQSGLEPITRYDRNP